MRPGVRQDPFVKFSEQSDARDTQPTSNSDMTRMRLGVRQDPFVKFSVQSDTRDFLTTNMVKTAPRINAGSNAEWRAVP